MHVGGVALTNVVTDRLTDDWTDGRTNRKTDRQEYGKTDRQADMDKSMCLLTCWYFVVGDIATLLKIINTGHGTNMQIS